MSEIKVKDLKANYQDPNSTSGTALSKTELKNLWTAAQDVEAGQTSDKPLSAGEASVFTSLVPRDVVSYARPYLAEIQAQIPSLIATPSTGVQPVPTKRGHKVFLTKEQGFAVDASGQAPASLQQLTKSVYGASKWLQASFGSGDNLFTKAALTNAGKQAVLQQFKNALSQDLSSLTAPQREQLLGSIAALTLELVKSVEQLPMLPQAETQALHNQAVDTFFSILDDTRLNPLAKRALVGYASQSDGFQKKLSAAQKASLNVRHDIFFPKTPADYDEWEAEKKSLIVVDHVCGQGENFVFGFIEQLKNDGLGNANGKFGAHRFKLVSGDTTYGPAVLRVTVPKNSPENKWGRDMTIEIRVREFDDDMYEGMGREEVDVVSYSGHSGFSKHTLDSLKNAPAQKGRKSVVRDLCCGADTKAAEAHMYPDAAVNSITSISSTYFRLKKHPTLGEYAYTSEGYSMLAVHLRGLLGKQNWDKIGPELKKHALWSGHDSSNNWTWATDKRAGSYMDDDEDGVPNVFDVLPNYDTTDIAASTLREFDMVTPDISPDEISGTRAFQAIQFLNTATNYNPFLQPYNKERRLSSHPEGLWFDGKEAPDTYARFTKAQDGKYQVQLSSALSDMTIESLRAVLYVEFVRFLAAQNTSLFASQAERNAQALVFAMSSIQNDNVYRDQPVYQGLQKLYGIPQAVTFSAVNTELTKADVDRHNYTGDRPAAQALVQKFANVLASAQVLEPAVLVS